MATGPAAWRPASAISGSRSFWSARCWKPPICSAGSASRPSRPPKARNRDARWLRFCRCSRLAVLLCRERLSCGACLAGIDSLWVFVPLAAGLVALPARAAADARVKGADRARRRAGRRPLAHPRSVRHQRAIRGPSARRRPRRRRSPASTGATAVRASIRCSPSCCCRCRRCRDRRPAWSSSSSGS